MTSVIPFNHGNSLNAPNVGGSQEMSCLEQQICPGLTIGQTNLMSMKLNTVVKTIKSRGIDGVRRGGPNFFLSEKELGDFAMCSWGLIAHLNKFLLGPNHSNRCNELKASAMQTLSWEFFSSISAAQALDSKSGQPQELNPDSVMKELFPENQTKKPDQIKTPDWNCIDSFNHQTSVLARCEALKAECERELGNPHVYMGLWSQCEIAKGNCTQDLQNAKIDKNVLDQCAEKQSQCETKKTECETKKAQCETDKLQSDRNWSDECEKAKGDCDRKLGIEIGKATANSEGWQRCNEEKDKCETDRGNCDKTLETEIGKATTNWRGWDQCNKDKAKCETDKASCDKTLETEIGKATTNWKGWDQCNKDKAKCETDKVKCERAKDDYREKLEEALRNATIYRNDRNGWDQCKRDKARALGAFKTANETAKTANKTADSYQAQRDACLSTEKTLRAEIDEQAQSINRYQKALESESMSIMGFNLSKNIFWNGVIGCACTLLGCLFGLILSRCGKNRPKGREEWDDTQDGKLETNTVMIEKFSRPSNRWGSSNTSDELRKLREFRINQEVLEEVNKKLAEEVELLSRN